MKIFIQSSFNNTLVYITDLDGNVLGWQTAGSQGFKGSKKSTPYAAGVAAKAVAETIKDKYNKHKDIMVEIFITGPGAGGESAIRSLGDYFVIEKIHNITGIPHNGCRPKKERRV